MERKIGQLTMDNDFFEKSLAAFQGSSPASRRQWRGCLFAEIQQGAEKGQAVNALCQMTGMNPYASTRALPGESGDADGDSWAEGRLGMPATGIEELRAACHSEASMSTTNACCG